MSRLGEEIEGSLNVTENGAYAHYVQVRHDRIAAELNLVDAISNWQKLGKPDNWKAHLHWLNKNLNDMRTEENRLLETL
jgi:hypothetical protein